MNERTSRPEPFATGLDSPRGLTFGPDGALYVAEGGRGGDASTVGRCRQIPEPVGPYTGGMTGRVSRIGADGGRTTVADGLPSSRSSDRSGGLVSGAADVAFVGETLYALVSGGGCSHGLPDAPNGVYRVDAERGTADLVADLGQWRATHEVARPDPNDDEYDGTWYSMIAAGDVLYAVEPNHGEIVRVGLDGSVERVADLSATFGHIVPTALAFRRGALFAGNLGRLPAEPGSAMVLRVPLVGEATQWAGGLTMVLGLAFDADGTLHALEVSSPDEPSRPKPGTGRVVRVRPDGGLEPVVSGLNFPTGMAFGPDGALYVSTFGFGPAGQGCVERIAM